MNTCLQAAETTQTTITIDETALRFVTCREAALQACKLDNPMLMLEYKVTYKQNAMYPNRPWLVVHNTNPTY